MTADQDAPEQPAVLTERRENVLLITLNRPAVRNAVNAALAAGLAGALEELDADAGLSVGVLTGAGGFFCAGMDLGAFVKGESPWFGDRGFAGIAQRSAEQAADRRDRGLRPGGGHGDRAGLRPDRRRQGREDGHPRGQALARGRRRRAAAPAQADALPRGDGAGADRRLRSRPSASTSSASSTAWPSPDPPSRRRSGWQERSPRTARSRSSPPSGSCRSSTTGRRRRCGPSRARSPVR